MAKKPSHSRKKGTISEPNKASSASYGLLPDERIEFGQEAPVRKATPEELNSRYAKGEIRIVTESARYSLAGILTMLDDTLKPSDDPGGKSVPRYEMDPAYQRRHRWDQTRKSRLIESFLMNVPVPPIFLYETELARYEVMDGRQRLTALREFYSNELVLEGLQYWTDLNGYRYSQLPSKVKDGIDRRYISSIILLNETATDKGQETFLKKIVFERLNSGGVKLSGQETRNAIYAGPLNELCLKLSTNELFRKLWRIPQNPSELEEEESEGDGSLEDGGSELGRAMFKKMEDTELVLRFFAYRQLDSFSGGLNRISDFLDKFLQCGNDFSADLLDGYEEMFGSTISFLWDALGPDAFCRLPWTGNPRPMKVVYDAVMYAANSPEVLTARTELVKNRELLIGELGAMYGANKKLFGGRATNHADAVARNALAQNAFAAAIARLP